MNAKLTFTEHDTECGARVETTITTGDLGMLVCECLSRMEPMMAYSLLGRLREQYGKKGVNG